MIALRDEDYEKCVEIGEAYVAAMNDYHTGANIAELMYGVLSQAGPVQEQRGKITLASACVNTGRLERAAELLAGIDYAKIEPMHLAQLINVLQELQYKSGADTAPLVTELWEGVSAEKPSKEKAQIRQNVFFRVAEKVFIPENQEKEQEKEEFCRPSYTLYLPLRGKCEVGVAAAMMEETDPVKLEGMLAEVDDWTRFPIHVLSYALEQGACFPLHGKPLNIEEMDSLAARLSADRERFLPIVEEAARSWDGGDGQQLAWRRGLALAAVQSFPWAMEDPDKESGLTLARIFANMERAFLPLCYSSEALTPDGLFLLPPMHRFGWYCAQAFDALDTGDTAGYVHCLREGLAACEGVKDIVEFLLEHTPQLQAPPPSQELLDLAEKVRTILSAYPPDDPSVLALKQTPVYQQVVHLIEGPDMGLYGGLLQ